jgi:NTE family protein
MIRKSKYPFRNLIFEGGGVRAYVYHGALRVFEAHGILQKIERVAGTSAGSLQAALLAFGLDAESTIALYKTIDHARIRNPEGEEANQSGRLDRMRDNLNVANRLLHRFGLYPNDYLKTWLEETIAAHCAGDGRATFADFRKRGFRDLYITAVNITRRRPEIFSADTTPDVAVADAVVMSSSIPFFFEAVQFDGKSFGRGDFYIDGGALNNYPLTLFDDPRFRVENRNFTYGVNWETLGCQQYTPEDCTPPNHEINNIFQYAESIIGTLTETQKVAVDMRLVDRLRTIRISNCCVASTDFDIAVDENNPKYKKLTASGEQAARAYLENYRLPTDRMSKFKGKLADLLDWRQ